MPPASSIKPEAVGAQPQAQAQRNVRGVSRKERIELPARVNVSAAMSSLSVVEFEGGRDGARAGGVSRGLQCQDARDTASVLYLHQLLVAT